MPTYDEVKAATIELVDLYALEDEVAKGYGKPPNTPAYSASTKMASIGLNVYVRRAMVNPINKEMRARFPGSWKPVGRSGMEAADTIGLLIELMCACAGVAVPHGEPT